MQFCAPSDPAHHFGRSAGMSRLRLASPSTTTLARCGCVSNWRVVLVLVLAGVLSFEHKSKTLFAFAQSKYDRFAVPRTEVGIANSIEQLNQLYFHHERRADFSWLDRLDGAVRNVA